MFGTHLAISLIVMDRTQQLELEVRALQQEMKTRLELQADTFKEKLAQATQRPLSHIKEYMAEIVSKYPEDDRIYHLNTVINSLSNKLERIQA